MIEKSQMSGPGSSGGFSVATAWLVAIAVAVVGLGAWLLLRDGNDNAPAAAATTTVEESTTTTDALATTVPVETTITDTTTTTGLAVTTIPDTTSGAGGDQPQCMDVWPTDIVLSILGGGYSFTETSADGSACVYLAGTTSVVVSLRVGDQGPFDAARSGASVTGDVQDLAVCDSGWWVDLGGPAVGEALDAGAQLILNITTGAVDDAAEVIAALLAAGCQ